MPEEQEQTSSTRRPVMSSQTWFLNTMKTTLKKKRSVANVLQTIDKKVDDNSTTNSMMRAMALELIDCMENRKKRQQMQFLRFGK